MSGNEPNQYEDNPCPHGEQTTALCKVCIGATPKPRRSVFITQGGTHFHHDRNCPTLESGQALVDERGGVRSHLISTYEDVIRHKRNPCRTCANPMNRKFK